MLDRRNYNIIGLLVGVAFTVLIIVLLFATEPAYIAVLLSFAMAIALGYLLTYFIAYSIRPHRLSLNRLALYVILSLITVTLYAIFAMMFVRFLVDSSTVSFLEAIIGGLAFGSGSVVFRLLISLLRY
jgi:hypothetical protein